MAMKKKKYLLEWDETSEQNNILGIVSSTTHLSFVHNLNKTTSYDFCRTDDLSKAIGNDTLYFVKYIYEDVEQSNRYVLVKNKGIGGSLGNEFKGFDYILILITEHTETLSKSKELLLSQSFIQAVVEVDTHKISEANKQLLEF